MSKLDLLLSLLVILIIVSYIGAGFSATIFRVGKQVGVVRLVGPIYSFKEITEQIRFAEEDERVKAVVLYVNSPGGAAYACMEIRRYMENMSKPNIAVMEELGASGAYYIASAADEILAHANTITGSLGVISIWEDYSEWLENEGIKFHVWKTGGAKDLYEPWRSPTQEENETIQRELNKTYEILIEDIARGRPNLTIEDVRKTANGSIYSGLEALELGLVDGLGDYTQAVKDVAARVRLGRYMTRDLSVDDRSYISYLFYSYIFSSVTLTVIIVLALIGVTKIGLRRIERSHQENIRSGM